jgi:hypothetical protein
MMKMKMILQQQEMTTSTWFRESLKNQDKQISEMEKLQKKPKKISGFQRSAKKVNDFRKNVNETRWDIEKIYKMNNNWVNFRNSKEWDWKERSFKRNEWITKKGREKIKLWINWKRTK